MVYSSMDCVSIGKATLKAPSPGSNGDKDDKDWDKRDKT